MEKQKSFIIFAICSAVVGYLLCCFVEGTFNSNEMNLLTKVCASGLWIMSLCAWQDIKNPMC